MRPHATFDAMWHDLADVGRHPDTGGYHRFAWTKADAELRDWFAGEALARGLDLAIDRAGNQWAWWGDPDTAVTAGAPGLVLGSHLDSVPDGGAYDGPLGVVSAFAVVDMLRALEITPARPIGIANFVDEEGARFGVACGGSRILTGQLSADRARGLLDGDGVSMAEAMAHAGHDPAQVGADVETMRRIGTFVELHVEQGRGLIDLERPVAVAESIIPHGRWRLDFRGEANHAGTTRLLDRHDPMLNLAEAITSARTHAEESGCVATIAKVNIQPNGVNAIPSSVSAWLDARGQHEGVVRRLASDVEASSLGVLTEESFTRATRFDQSLGHRIASVLEDAPMLPTGAGHDAGILAAAGIPTAMLFVRNPTGVSHSPAEYAEVQDCHAGLVALASVVTELACHTENESDPGAN